ncbi:MAG: hypothetical protein ACAI35_12890 [Candidatus Methylacidiphilales bacterium]|nr:hypothetical protein [Candidatus Methylacidiphilales bacterium]
MPRFNDLKQGFAQIVTDPHCLAKVLLGGFLLINPFLLALIPTFVAGLANPQAAVPWVQAVFPYILAFNVLTFWFPLGFTYEVLRRARSGQGRQLPDWSLSVLPRYAKEGAVKLVIAITTLLLPVGLYMGTIYGIFIVGLGLPASLLSMFLQPIMLLVIPFCGVACCRWLDGAGVLNSALNYPENIRLFKLGWKDYLIASAFLIGVNSVTTAFYYTIPFGAVFGLCLVDTWFGPIYAETVRLKQPATASKEREGVLTASKA